MCDCHDPHHSAASIDRTLKGPLAAPAILLRIHTHLLYLHPRFSQNKWRLYPYKGKEALDVIHIHRMSAYLCGKEKKVCDLFMAHPSISKQHAAIQYRLVTDSSAGKAVNKVKPYIIDLDSTNGTFVNDKKIEVKRYVELLHQDRIKFGFSSREYMLICADFAEGKEADTTANDFGG